MKKILLVFPNNFLAGGQGTNTRVMQLALMLKELGYKIDILAFENFNPDNSFENFDELNKDNIINKLYIYDFEKGYKENLGSKRTLLNRIKVKLKSMFYNNKETEKYLHSWVKPGVQRLFDEIVEENNYDVISTFYTYLADVFANYNGNAKKVYFMEDCMFLQQYSWEKDKTEKNKLGMLINEEIEKVKYFDEIFSISYDEKIMYEKFTGKAINFFPHVPKDVKKVTTPVDNRKWDILFIGFNNPYNVEGLNWFIEEVYQYLNKDMKIVFVGSATKSLEVTHSNIDIIPFAPDLDEIYDNIKISICPMFQGTGMKIKVVESLSKGIPVVCNERGVDGFPDKMMSGCLVTQDPKEFAEFINKLCDDEIFYKETTKISIDYFEKMFDVDKYKNMLEKYLSNNN